MERRLWTREELILALNLYLKLPFGKLHSRTPEIIYLSELIGRTPGSVAMRLNNFASVDPFHQQRGVAGLTGGKKQVEPIWEEFSTNTEGILFESEQLLAQLENNPVEMKYAHILKGTDHLKGKTKLREIKTRVNQNVFRQIVLANYSSTCAISGLNIQDLLIASHIVPWSKNEKERLNPENGLCLSALYDQAFDKGLIAINTRFEVILSKDLKIKKYDSYYGAFFGSYEGKKIYVPGKYYPRKEFLEYHLDMVFSG
jgi:putative restriction endonuclease